MTLEKLIKSMTIATPSGGRYNIGKASISVSYCSDFWEWEYLGETYWDVQDLAEAIAGRTVATPSRRELGSKLSKIQHRTVRKNHSLILSFLDVRRLILSAMLVRMTSEIAPLPARTFCPDGLTTSKRRLAWSAHATSNSIIVPYATEGFGFKTREHQLDGVGTSS